MEQHPQINVPRVKLGSQALEALVVVDSGIYNSPLPHEEGILVVKRAFDSGITFFDTSDLYGENHDNEIMVGKALKQLPREKIQIATKFGCYISKDGQFHAKGTPDYVRKSCESSLNRLGVDYIDLYYQHRVDTLVPIEDTMGELKKLVEGGKIRYIGLSEASVDNIPLLCKCNILSGVGTLKMIELGIGVVTYSPLGRGFFGGKAVVENVQTESFLNLHPRFIGENLEKNRLLYNRLDALSTKHSCCVPQLALAWLFHQGDDIVPIPGTTKIKNLNTNIESLALKLKAEELKEISDAIPVDEVSGEQDPDVLSKLSYKFDDTPVKHVI